jgi:hypothetical protein
MSQKTPDHNFQDYANAIGTNIVHPLGAAMFFMASVWTFVVPRKYAAWSLIFIACFISPAQRFAFLTLDFDFQRAVVILLVARAMILGEFTNTRIILIDYCMVAMVLVIVVSSGLREGTGEMIRFLGSGVDTLGIYAVGRTLVRKFEDLRCLLLGAMIASVPVMVFFTVEQMTQWNFFSLLGGVPETTYIRDGNLRAQGAFTHPIIAGMFWATFAAMFIGVIFSGRRSILTTLVGWGGTATSCIIAIMTNSSTPIAGFLVTFGAWCCFPLRMHLRLIRWVIFAGLVFVHLIHPKGVHAFIFTNFSAVSGSTGAHRYILIDGALSNIGDWALYGSRARYNYAFYDITCDYVFTAVNGGLLALALEITIITLAFYACGRTLRAARNREELFLAYGVGAALLTVMVMAMAVTVYGQARVPFYLTIGIAASLGTLEWLPKRRTHVAAQEHQMVAGGHQSPRPGGGVP